MLARKIILGFGFAILVPMLTHFGVDLLFPSPSWRDREDTKLSRELAQLQTQERRTTDEAERVRLQQRIDLLQSEQDRRQDTFNERADQAHQMQFFIGAPIGVMVTILGSLIRVQAVGGGLMLGGIFTFTQGCAWYWGDLDRVGRFLVLLVAFGVLLWIGYQRLSELKQVQKPS